MPGNFTGTADLAGTAFASAATTGFLFDGLYNFRIGATPALIAARNAQALCGLTGTQSRPQFHGWRSPASMSTATRATTGRHGTAAI